jgi:lysine 2,3-aminomutase
MIDVEFLNQFAEVAKRENLLPLRVTPYYQKLVEEELAVLKNTNGPIYKVVYPTPERLKVRAPGEVKDFVEDRDNMPEGLGDMVLRKYRNRLLFLITDKCAAHCMYCFRQDVLAEQHERDVPTFDTKLGRLIQYLQARPEVEEVIFSGGDPLNVPLRMLRASLERISRETSVTNFRLHTRNAAFAPKAFTPEACRLLGDYNVRLVLHMVHPYEIRDEAVAVIKSVQSFGVRCYSQFPVLRGINDHAAVLERLLRRLDELGVRPLSLFIADPINYSASFRIPLARLFSIMDELNWRTSAWINSVRLVLDSPIGKVRREDISGWDKEAGVVTFSRDGEQVVYPDFPQEFDEQGDLQTLLWKS